MVIWLCLSQCSNIAPDSAPDVVLIRRRVLLKHQDEEIR